MIIKFRIQDASFEELVWYLLGLCSSRIDINHSLGDNQREIDKVIRALARRRKIESECFGIEKEARG